jgi:hypothetical protein
MSADETGRDAQPADDQAPSRSATSTTPPERPAQIGS